MKGPKCQSEELPPDFQVPGAQGGAPSGPGVMDDGSHGRGEEGLLTREHPELGRTRYQGAEGDTWVSGWGSPACCLPWGGGGVSYVLQDPITAIWAGETGTQGSWRLLSTPCPLCLQTHDGQPFSLVLAVQWGPRASHYEGAENKTSFQPSSSEELPQGEQPARKHKCKLKPQGSLSTH